MHKAAYTIPPQLIVGEKQLLAKVEAGADLWPHQSRKISNLAIQDGMLNDYGIQHFHLGTSPDPRRPELIEGTSELLFAIVTDHDFYSIGIYDHKAWNKQTLLDVVHSTWPNLTEPYTIKGGPHMKVVGLSRNYTDDEAAKFRATGINVLQQRPDGSIQMGLGGGVTLDGSSFLVRREVDRLIVYLEELQLLVTDALESMPRAGDLPIDAAVQLIWDREEVFAVPNPPVVKVNLTSKLLIPAL